MVAIRGLWRNLKAVVARNRIHAIDDLIVISGAHGQDIESHSAPIHRVKRRRV
jgi:hypothetical protein